MFSSHPLPYGLPTGQIPVFSVANPLHLHTPLPPTTQPIPQHIPIQPQNEKMNLALEFLEQVKQVYHDQPYVYSQFLDIMKEFKNQRYCCSISTFYFSFI